MEYIWNINCRQDFVDPGKGSFRSFLRIAASRPAGLPRWGHGAPLQAEAGQATTAVKLQCNIFYNKYHNQAYYVPDGKRV